MDPRDKGSHLSDARLKFSNQAIAILRALAAGEIVLTTPVVSLLKSLGLIDHCGRVTEQGREVLANHGKPAV